MSSLQYDYEELKDRLCDYHQAYITKKNRWHNPPCVCTQHPREAYCHRCGYCHCCGADLTTTSTPNFHRCSCPVCLAVCCGLFGAHPEQYQHALSRHRGEREAQEEDRCPRGSPLEDRPPHSAASPLNPRARPPPLSSISAPPTPVYQPLRPATLPSVSDNHARLLRLLKARAAARSAADSASPLNAEQDSNQVDQVAMPRESNQVNQVATPRECPASSTTD